MNHKLIVRVPLNPIYNQRKYQVSVSGQTPVELNYRNDKAEFELPQGRYQVEISAENDVQTQELTLGAGQQKTILVHPRPSYSVILAFLLGLAAATILIQYPIQGKTSLLLALIPLAPLLFLRKRQFTKRFAVFVQ
jgi:hypothetical protein